MVFNKDGNRGFITIVIFLLCAMLSNVYAFQPKEEYPLVKKITYTKAGNDFILGELFSQEFGGCIHPDGGWAGRGVELIIHEACTKEDRLKFILTSEGSLKTKAYDEYCVHPSGGSPYPPAGTPLVFWDGCDESRLQFFVNENQQLVHKTSGFCITINSEKKLELNVCDSGLNNVQVFSSIPESGAIIQHVSGLCMGRKSPLNPLTQQERLYLQESCGELGSEDEFAVLSTGVLMHVDTGWCVHPEGGVDIPGNSTPLVLYPTCGNNDTLKFELTEFGSLRHKNSGLCVHPYGGSANPVAGTLAVLWEGCDEDRLKFSIKPSRYICADGAVDDDADTLCNNAEILYGTNPSLRDSDGDGFSDGAEALGWNGINFLQLGADPKYKDIFVRVDYYKTNTPDLKALKIVRNSFADSPVSNPNFRQGINLHLDVSSEPVPDALALNSLSLDKDDFGNWPEFDAIKALSLSGSKARVYHYALYANLINEQPFGTGMSRGIGARDFVLGNPLSVADDVKGSPEIWKAGTFMHELGHNLGLGHGGADIELFKLNYLSIMGYRYQMRGLSYLGDPVIDFSRIRTKEVGLIFDEARALDGVDVDSDLLLQDYKVRSKRGSLLSGSAASNLDYDSNGIHTDVVTIQSGEAGPESQNDWDHLVYMGTLAFPIGDDLGVVDFIKYFKTSLGTNFGGSIISEGEVCTPP